MVKKYTICSKYGKFEKPKIPYLLEITLVLSIFCSKCQNEDEKLFKEEESIKCIKYIFTIYLLYIYFKNKAAENMSQEFRLKKKRQNKKLCS